MGKTNSGHRKEEMDVSRGDPGVPTTQLCDVYLRSRLAFLQRRVTPEV